jgi:hypothetical protein
VRTITRVYNNNEFVRIDVADADLVAELLNETTYRPGCAIFVGSKCLQRGYLSKTRIAGWEAKLKDGWPNREPEKVSFE